jgi:SAM-dependent methyltransferase
VFENYGTPAQRYVELSEIYDALFPFDADSVATVKFLAALAPQGRMLELGVGTGRIALPLADLGCEVTGVDSSPEMIATLKSKDADGKIRIVMGDMASPPVSGPFDVVFMLYNTVAALLSQELQLRCVESASGLLAPHGRLVIEAKMPTFALSAKPVINMTPLQSDDLRSLSFEVIQHDHIRQILEYRHMYFFTDGVKILPSVHRYVHLSELDLMGRLAGLQLDARHGDWEGGALDAKSTRHISVYRKIARS